MAWNLKDLDTLENAIATGATSVQYQDRRVNYRDLTEMLKIRGLMRRALGLTQPGKRDVKIITDKGVPGLGVGPFLGPFPPPFFREGPAE